MGSNGLNVIKLLAEYHCCPAPEAAKELPRHPTGKLYETLLKDKYWAKHKNQII